MSPSKPSTPRILEPELLPVVSTGANLPPIPAARLTPDGLRARFKETLDWSQEAPEARIKAIGGDPRVASVLVALVVRDHGLSVLLTQRADHLSDHAGQISFPGGRREPEDADAAATALREAHEEVGLAPERVEVLGAMPDYLTGTGFRVTPVVALVHPPFTLTADTLEVADIFEVPLAFLMNPAHHEVRLFKWEGGERRFFAMPYVASEKKAPYFIWGATAGMLRNFYRFLAA
ncbi:MULTISPECIES: CoA pyrophosphatase [unclassified Caballeronia]|uniref:CoA pyrophosphatase n=1 Tax=unclassified Caballeronia TaxID=2646786 RepID=UPI002866449C|nr:MULTISPECIES: CoA pyrophosphatase [unclassified Caballeronia]MDR5751231.1 CoA pyrophosphatase [Caballeronia sp. LZ024]MDR5844632.1 CoA pyrophosphatase [Caballeronia sp. LZ031]